jgi:ATP-binding cassette subfamily C (CFTR/MRP) protein 1
LSAPLLGFNPLLTEFPSVTGKSPHTLHLTAFGILKWPIIQTIFPRACLTALMFCQPFLINRTIRLSQEAITEQTTQAGYGLIGAYFLVYVGIAVRAFLSWESQGFH